MRGWLGILFPSTLWSTQTSVRLVEETSPRESASVKKRQGLVTSGVEELGLREPDTFNQLEIEVRGIVRGQEVVRQDGLFPGEFCS